MEAILIPITFFVAIAVTIIWVSSTSNRRREVEARSQADVHHRLLEKFGTSKDFIDFMQTDGGKVFLKPLPVANPAAPYRKILASTTAGVILSMFGIALLILHAVAFDSEEGMIGGGIIFLMIGLGFLVSAAISYRLSKAWGLLQTRSPEAGTP